MCVRELADKLDMDYKQSFNYLNKCKAIQFIKENYEVEHTLSIDDAIECMAIITGGEAAVRKDCFEIIDYLDSLDIPFCFASNSLIMNETRLKKLANIGI